MHFESLSVTTLLQNICFEFCQSETLQVLTNVSLRFSKTLKRCQSEALEDLHYRLTK